MKPNHDLVDQAMNLLRAGGDAAGPTLNPELENRLMQKFDAHTTSARPMRAKTLVIALALVAVSGVTFAATGGIERIKSWFVTVEVDGQQMKLLVGDNQEASLVSESSDGVKTEVKVKKATNDDGSDRTRVSVVKTAPGSQTKEVSEIVRKVGGAPIEAGQFTMDDIGDTKPLKSWQDENGLTNEVYLVRSVDSKGGHFFYVTAAGTEEASVRKLVDAGPTWFAEGTTCDVTIDENGTFTMKATNSDGNEQVMKIRIRSRQHTSSDEGDMMEGKNIQIESPDGGVKIKIDENTEPQNP